jgi:hypothetical protein
METVQRYKKVKDHRPNTSALEPLNLTNGKRTAPTKKGKADLPTEVAHPELVFKLPSPQRRYPTGIRTILA